MEEQCERGITEIAEGPSVCAPAEGRGAHYPSAVLEEAAFGTKMWLERPFGETLDALRRALDVEGFEIAVEIEVDKLLRADPGVRFPRYTIVEAWYPSYSQQALQADMDSGLLLPHNITVFERSNGTVVSAVDPITQFRLIDGSELRDLAVIIKQRLQDVLDRVASGEIERAA